VIYLGWRVLFSVPFGKGSVAVVGNLLLLGVELLGFAESLVMYCNLMGLRAHPLPVIPDDAWPEVDIFIATYNEPVELLYKTVNGCNHLRYPNPKKVHIWICDDNRRPEMRALAEKMGVGYFDRPDNQGAKAGNLNHALARTSAPFVVTLDADMIPQSRFLLNTIPYFVDAELRCAGKSEEEHIRLGLLQTPQAFYDPDVFQHALYSERRAPNEQDFFYRTIEPAKTSTNSVIYGGSNTVLSRKALEDIGGFYTGSITEDFATGLLIESAGYVSLALPEPLASGQTPHTFREHIQQRTRWGRGVIVTARKLGLFQRKGLSAAQKFSYWSSVVYWYSPIKNLIYMLSPLLFALFAVPVFRCNWMELLVFWLPMFVLQDLTLRVVSRGEISQKWSGIYETGVMVHLFVPILKEAFGITLSAFKVTDKSAKTQRRQTDMRAMMPFLFLALLCLFGIVRVLFCFETSQTISLLILLFWLIRNLYFLVMALFLVDGRESDGEIVKVYASEAVHVTAEGGSWEGVTTLMTEHSLNVFLDESENLSLGTPVRIRVNTGSYSVELSGCVTNMNISRSGTARTHMIEILDFNDSRDLYLQILYDRIPTLPQSLQRDFGILTHLWQNIAHRVARTRR
jgi:cellulose synthase (UDP-forming)